MAASDWLKDPNNGVVPTVRPSQVAMCDAVEDIIKRGGIAFIQAPTGTGKSYAYTIPSLLTDKTVVISTAKKALQKQLLLKDLPFLCDRLGVTKKFALMKGKSNFVCQIRLSEFYVTAKNWYKQQDIELFEKWFEENPLGDLDEAPTEFPFTHHFRVTECAQRQCELAGRCGYRQHKDSCNGAKIIIVNHALLALNFAMQGAIFGKPDVLIIDEAHQAPAAFRDAYTYKINAQQVDLLHKMSQNTCIKIDRQLDTKVALLLASLPAQDIVQPNAALAKAAAEVADALMPVQNALMNLGVWSESTTRDIRLDAKEIVRLKAVAAQTKKLLKACDIMQNRTDSNEEHYVTYTQIEEDRNGTTKSVITAPIEISGIVGKHLKEHKSVIITSATLATAGTFDYIAREFGLRPSDITEKHILPHTFNYSQLSCLYIAETIPTYSKQNEQAFWDSCSNEIADLCNASGGGAFILCASFRDLKAFYERLSKRGVKNLIAQEGSIESCVTQFKETPGSVLLGVRSLWEGVDIPGLKLRLVVIPRLPFPTPEDPVFRARKKHLEEVLMRAGIDERKAALQSWQTLDLQCALIDFQQGAGRLIRSESDRGVVAVLDSRIARNAKSYAAIVRKSIPHPVTYDKANVLKFLQVLRHRSEM
jgi:ATP-dependent DNA helicase DinG